MNDRIAQLTNKFWSAASGSEPNASSAATAHGNPVNPDKGNPTPDSQEQSEDQGPTNGQSGSQAPATGKGGPKKGGVQTRSAAKIGVVPDSEETEPPATATASKGKGSAKKPGEGPIETISLLGEKNGPKDKTRSLGKNNRASKRATILAEALAATKAGQKDSATTLWEVYLLLSATPTTVEIPKIVPAKHAREESIEVLGQSADQAEPQPKQEVVVLQEGELDFAVNEINSHKDVGFTPYFDKNLKELRAPIPLTIFNKKWQDRAILHYAEKRPKTEDSSSENRNRYTGLPYPSELTQSFSKWTTNHQGFYVALRNVYQFRTFAGWVLTHKSHCDRILARHRFMAALRYDVNVRSTVFAHRVIVNGRPTVADISVYRQDIAEETYSNAWNFGKIGMTDNPYANNGP